MALVGYEWGIIVPIAVIIWYWWMRRKRNLREAITVSLVRSRGAITMDDIILNVHITASEANKIVQDLISKRVIRVEDKEGKTFYTSA